MTGTLNQVEWAEQIKVQVNAEFDRVAKALTSAAGKQTARDRSATLAVIAILEEKRAEAMGKDQAGYFIRNWQELRDQVRRMITEEPRYQVIQARRAARLTRNAQARFVARDRRESGPGDQPVAVFR